MPADSPDIPEMKAAILVDALERIGQLQDQTLVVALIGTLANETRLEELLTDTRLLQQVGVRPVIVHQSATTATTVVELNEQLAAKFEDLGGRAMTLNSNSTSVLFASENSSEAAVSRVDRLVIDNLCYAGQVPVIPAICQSGENEVPVDAADAAVAIAVETGALIVAIDISENAGDVIASAASGTPSDHPLRILFDSKEPHGLLQKLLLEADRDPMASGSGS